MIVKFLQDYKAEVKSFVKGDISNLHWQLANELLKEKVITTKLSRREIKKLEQIGKETKDGNNRSD